ncbi:MAG: ABC transporter ATP-binding protein [Bacteroidetes bacterium GWD2_45_23]|nr:MAG: ABC transporter ATP-binding protein [Bacteroidetes bacterium GWC2_46_850]OFX74499.1 MAG: ABC transporter ATP-binding protein [Bacteroidetes bacterium GWC1_47_7]OFX82452.1 MAG: ABC transporter ATP-binding protein [Bacteroidetes bacterium GWD2_45_23]HBB01108.1 ABC transporter ATP-binding protein [Porphyromonadaceae bacterium]HCC18761.1 ABC transporter ATP-binding protein [Porphyromonadaceae bacterium]
MFDLDRWQEIWITITHNKSRSVLTAFGVFWGMLMLVLMVGAGNALEQGMTSQIEGFATNSCFFESNRTTVPYKGFRKGRRWNMTNSDIPVIREKVKELQYISPVLFSGGNDKNVVRGDKNGSYLVKGCYPEYDLIERSKMIYGRYVNDIDIAEKRKVCVIGERIYEVLFHKGEDPTGKQIRVNGIYFQVIGVARSTSGVSIGGQTTETVVLPFSTMQQAFNQGNIIHFLAATAKKGVPVRVIQDKILEVLKQQHQIAPEDKEAVFNMNIEEQFKMFNYLGIGIAALIWIVGLGTIFAGAIGVSNIMLVTVRERTKEIGIRRALGATPRNIIGQILSESIVLTVLAGITGIVVGVGLLRATGIVLSQGDQFFKDPQISFGMAVASLLILLVIGTFAGYIPAQRAMMIKPVEAIGEE